MLASTSNANDGEIRVSPLSANILDRSTKSKNLVIRPEQEEALKLTLKLRKGHIEDQGTENAVVMLTGSPGIGKSWSALYYMRLLAKVEENTSPILYEFGTETDRKRLIFVPPQQDGDNRDWVCYATKSGKMLDLPGLDMRKRRELDVVIDPL